MINMDMHMEAPVWAVVLCTRMPQQSPRWDKRHPGVFVLKYDTLGAKLLKCSVFLSGANLLKWVSPHAKLLP